MPSLKEARARMQDAVEAVQREFATVRTGKATPGLLDTVRVDAYGAKMPLNQVATVNTPEPSLIVVQPFDKTLIGEIERGIQSADIGQRIRANLAEIEIALQKLESSALAQHYLDLPYMAELFQTVQDKLDVTTRATANRLLRGLAIGLFLQRFEDA